MLTPILRPILSSPLHGLFGRETFPSGAILHYDADIDAFSEQTGGPHTFNHNVLSPQFQLNADGSYSNVGAKVAVDVFGGKKWVRSCGSVQNLLPNSECVGAGVGVVPTGWRIYPLTSGITMSVVGAGDGYVDVRVAGTCVNAIYYGAVEFSSPADWPAAVLNDVFTASCEISLVGGSNNGIASRRIEIAEYTAGNSWLGANNTPAVLGQITHHTKAMSITNVAKAVGNFGVTIPIGNTVDATFRVKRPQLTKTAYPLPYVPTRGTVQTMPASNATTTNGCWFTNPNGSPLWQALTGSPLTLATRVRMGVGGGDIAANTALEGVSCSASGGTILRAQDISGSKYPATSNDSTTPALSPAITWSRNAVMRRFVQVNTAGTQFRVGYMIEGTHTTIQWGSWAAYDGSFGPSTLYRLMLNFNNPYPMWFNKITAWREQVSDARILEAMA